MPKPKLAEVAYRQMLRAVNTGEMRAGERLTEADLCKRLNMSRTPVREALNRLVADGILVATPRCGVTVREIDLPEIIDLFHVREALETQAARMAAERITDAELEELYALCDVMDAPPQDDQAQHYSRMRELDVEFHLRLVALSGERTLVDLYNDHHLIQLHMFCRQWIQTARFHALVGPHGRLHRPIVDALATRDPEKADRAIRAAVQEGIQRHLRAVGASAQALTAAGKTPTPQMAAVSRQRR